MKSSFPAKADAEHHKIVLSLFQKMPNFTESSCHVLIVKILKSPDPIKKRKVCEFLAEYKYFIAD